MKFAQQMNLKAKVVKKNLLKSETEMAKFPQRTITQNQCHRVLFDDMRPRRGFGTEVHRL